MLPDHPLIQVVKLLDEEKIPHCLIGGYAVAIYGEPRATFDVDFMVNTTRAKLMALAEKFRSMGWDIEFRKSDLLDPVGDVLRIYRPFAADLLRARPGLEEDCVKRAETIVFGDKKIKVVAPLDIILLLLRAGDPRSYYDALGIIRLWEETGKKPDESILLAQAEKYGLKPKMLNLLKGEFKWDY